MKPRLASVRAAGGLDRVDRAVQLLEDEWRRHGDVPLEKFWNDQKELEETSSIDSLETLAALVKADLRRRFEQGETPQVAGYLEQFPDLRAAESRVLSLVYEEFCLHEERGNAPDVASFCGRYPEWQSSLVSQLRYHRLFSQVAGGSPPQPRFPQPGENFEEFSLVSLLGKGGTSRVFLAKDLSLGGKQVALKVTLDRGQEPNVQGPLDHPHIVPVNSVCYPNEGPLFGLCMPYRPGLPLDEIIKRVQPASRPRDAMTFWRALSTENDYTAAETAGGIANQQPSPRGDGWAEFPARKPYHHGAAWIVMLLARALDYAHRRGTFHRDVKPANVLLTTTHGPQLLDFNLAEAPHSSDHAQAALHGGTLPYMAPEQIAAFLNPALWKQVGAQADIYSLGFVLRELLTGQTPEAPDETLPPARAMSELLDRRSLVETAVRRLNPAIPQSLEAIVAKCLKVSPGDRYSDAGALARDLERFLKYQRLVEAGNPSQQELALNWLTRHRKLLTTAAATFGLGAIIYAAALFSPIKDRQVTPVASLPAFGKAVELLEAGDAKTATILLSGLVKSHPESCLAKLYLAIALKDQPKSDIEALSQFRDALSVPRAADEVTDWAQLHPEVKDLLVDFVKARMIHADELAEKYDAEDIASDQERDAELKNSAYDLARKALLIAEKLDPSSRTIQRLLARTEEVFGVFKEAHQRLNQLIDGSAQSEEEYSSERATELFFCRKLRGRVALLWAEQLREQNAPIGSETVVLLNDAIDDLKWCKKVLSDYASTVDSPRKEYKISHDTARAMLTLAEVESDLKLTQDADQHLELAGKMIDRLKERALSLSLKGPIALITRHKETSARFKRDQGVARGRSPEVSPSTPAKNWPPSG
jgi:serine/threonine protein kinase